MRPSCIHQFQREFQKTSTKKPGQQQYSCPEKTPVSITGPKTFHRGTRSRTQSNPMRTRCHKPRAEQYSLRCLFIPGFDALLPCQVLVKWSWRSNLPENLPDRLLDKLPDSCTSTFLPGTWNMHASRVPWRTHTPQYSRQEKTSFPQATFQKKARPKGRTPAEHQLRHTAH